MKKMMSYLQRQVLIELSNSPWTSNVGLVRKKDGSLRCYIDYGTRSILTIKISYSLPRIDDTLDAVVGDESLSNLDIKPGYYQFKIAEQDKDETAFYYGQGLAI